jgi:hypothetical protein
LFWRVADDLDYLVMLVRLRILETRIATATRCRRSLDGDLG